MRPGGCTNPCVIGFGQAIGFGFMPWGQGAGSGIFLAPGLGAGAVVVTAIIIRYHHHRRHYYHRHQTS